MLLGWVIVMAAVGAFLGDNLAYWIGRSAENWARRWITRGEKGQRGLQWAHRELDRHGGSLVIVARFIPGGRTATTISCGVLHFPYRQFLAFDGGGAVLWATINVLIGYFGGAHVRQQRDRGVRAVLRCGVGLGVCHRVDPIATPTINAGIGFWLTQWSEGPHIGGSESGAPESSSAPGGEVR